MAVKQIAYLPLDAIEPNPSNPPDRMTPAANRGLTKSVRGIGLQYPILVSKKDGAEPTKYVIIDGHRRYSVYVSENRDDIPCIVAEGNLGQLYADVNASTRPLTGSDWAIVYVTGGTVPPGRTRNNLIKLSQLVGNDVIRQMADAGIRPGIYNTAQQVCRHAYKGETDDQLRQIVQWLVKHRQAANCRSVIQLGQDVAPIKSAIEEDRPVRLV